MSIGKVAEKVLVEEPYLALRINNQLFRETVYGVVKRFRFLIDHIEAYRQQHQLEVDQMRILDVGCGTGINITIPLAIAGYLMVGLDLDEASIKRAKQTGNRLKNIGFYCLELDRMDISRPFHAIICSEVLEHLAEPADLIRQMGQVLAEDGLLLVTVPNGYGYFEGERFVEEHIPHSNEFTDQLQHRLIYKFGSEQLKSRHKSEWKPEHYQLAWSSLAHDQTHYQRFTPTRLQDLLMTQGFKILEFRNRSFLAGNILNNFVRDWDGFLKWNCDVADRLPHRVCSGWMVAAHRANVSQDDDLI